MWPQPVKLMETWNAKKKEVIRERKVKYFRRTSATKQQRRRQVDERTYEQTYSRKKSDGNANKKVNNFQSPQRGGDCTGHYWRDTLKTCCLFFMINVRVYAFSSVVFTIFLCSCYLLSLLAVLASHSRDMRADNSLTTFYRNVWSAFLLLLLPPPLQQRRKKIHRSTRRCVVSEEKNLKI